MTVVVACAAAVLTACASGTHPAGGAAAGAGGASQASLAKFCTDYTWAANAISNAYGDPKDPNFAQGMQYLLTAKNEAPAGIAGAVNTLYTQLDFALKNPTKTVDVSAMGEQVTVWAEGHCPAAASSSGAANSPSNVPNSTDANTDTSTDSSGAVAPGDTGSSATDSSSAPTLATALCNQLLNAVNTVDVLASQADTAGGAPPSLSQWQDSEASLNALKASLASGNASQQLQNDVGSLVSDVQDIVANGGSSSTTVSVDASSAKNDAAQSSCTSVSN